MVGRAVSHAAPHRVTAELAKRIVARPEWEDDNPPTFGSKDAWEPGRRISVQPLSWYTSLIS